VNSTLHGRDIFLKGTNSWLSTISYKTILFSWDIWLDINSFHYGSSKREAQSKKKQDIHNQVSATFANPSKLHHRFPCITQIPLEDCLHQNNTILHRLLVRLSHQIKISNRIQISNPDGQLTISQVFRYADMHRQRQFPIVFFRTSWATLEGYPASYKFLHKGEAIKVA
jgi:hypothetical protein